ncbi:MAG TPA: plastocyanin/azurin family copper-binding protein [Actinomycetes bacterium]|nr:plastocyanin/azurin family copper-binding protein [Actinomycetes bacterium]
MTRAGLLGRAGLCALLLAAAGCARPAVAGQRTVVLDVRHSRFLPDHLTARVGDTVTFVVRNTDPIDHELIVGDEAVHRRHEHGRERHHHGDVPGEVSVPAGAERRTTFTFTHPGRVEFACHLPGHWAYGMRGEVRVDGG